MSSFENLEEAHTDTWSFILVADVFLEDKPCNYPSLLRQCIASASHGVGPQQSFDGWSQSSTTTTEILETVDILYPRGKYLRANENFHPQRACTVLQGHTPMVSWKKLMLQNKSLLVPKSVECVHECAHTHTCAHICACTHLQGAWVPDKYIQTKPGGSVVKNLLANAGGTRDARNKDWIPGLERYPQVGNDNPLQYSCLKNSMDRGAWWITIHRGTTEQLSTHTHTHTHTHIHTCTHTKVRTDKKSESCCRQPAWVQAFLYLNSHLSAWPTQA